MAMTALIDSVALRVPEFAQKALTAVNGVVGAALSGLVLVDWASVSTFLVGAVTVFVSLATYALARRRTALQIEQDAELHEMQMRVLRADSHRGVEA